MNISYHLGDSNRSKSVGRSSSMGSSPRMVPLNSTMKKNVLFTASVDDSLRLSYRGPGSYFQSDDNYSVTSSTTSPLRRKSHNIRVQNGNSIGKETAQKYLSKEQQTQHLLASPIKIPHSSSSRRIVKKAWSADEVVPQSTPSKSQHPFRYPISQPHTPIDLTTSRSTPYHHQSYEHFKSQTSKH